MRRLILGSLTVLLCMSVAANLHCNVTPPVAQTVTIQYINSTNAPILVDLLASNDSNITQDALLADGTLYRDTVPLSPPPLEFQLSCTDAAAIIIDRAVLLTTDGPEIGSVILYEGTDFACGETASFEFTTDTRQTQLFVSFAHF